MRILSVPLKEDDDKEKIRRRVVKKLKQLEQHIASGAPSDSSIRVVEELQASNVVRVAANSRYLVFLLKDGRVCRMKCHSRTERAGRHRATEELLKKKTRDTPFQLLSDAEYARQLQAEFNMERMLPPVQTHHPPLRSEDISPYIHVPATDPPWEPGLDNFFPIPNIPLLPPPPPSPPPSLPSSFLSATQYPDQSVPVGNVESHNSTSNPLTDRSRSNSRSVRFLLPDDTSKPVAREGEGLKHKEGVWPEIGTLQWLVMKKVREVTIGCNSCSWMWMYWFYLFL